MYRAILFDPIARVKSNLDEVKGILVEDIEKILERGVKIETLVQKSKDLSDNSKKFVKAARKHRKGCCIIM